MSNRPASPSAAGAGLLGPILIGALLAGAFAWPSQGRPLAGLLCGLAAALAAFWGMGAGWLGRPRCAPSLAAIAFAGLWTLWAVLGVRRAAVHPNYAAFGAQALAGFWLFLGAAWWTANGQRGIGNGGGERSGLNRSALILLGAVALCAAGMALYVTWQRYAGYERSFEAFQADPEAFSGDVEMREAIQHALKENRPGGTFFQPNLAAALMALGAGLSLAIAAVARRRMIWIAAPLVSAVCVFGVILTQSRGGLLTAAAALAGGALLIWRPRPVEPARPKRSSRRTWLATGAAALILICVLIALGATPLGAEWRRRLTAGTTIKARLDYWQAAGKMFAAKPILGHGADSFALLYPQYRLPGSVEARYPHNWIARFGSELGAVGLALFAGWIAAVFIAVLRRWRRGGPDPAAAALFGAGLLLFNGLFEFSLSTRELYMALCVLLGVAAAGVEPSVSRGGSGAVSALCAVLALGAAWPFQWREDWTEALRNDSQEASRAAVDARSAGDAFEAALWGRIALEKLESASALEPRNPWILDTMALTLAFQPESQDMARAGQLQARAVELHPDSATLRIHHAWILEAAGRPDEALEELNRAVELHAFAPEPFENRALLLERLGRFDEALGDARKALAVRRSSIHIAQELVDRLEKEANAGH